ncbi:cytoskeletal protein RodZ [Azospirillum brasilense]|uniref:Cytoskeletal protein RodZ n=1 Tax=Azospirillum brasilense TaxID=192 RepID=A0A560C0Q9_AZOBR|nr:helix-turn-helix domain-containing protein [Azospirillum brasilense]TWA78379.1 cytoskeletal protein RodZ [Azospirillum brasilense]
MAKRKVFGSYDPAQDGAAQTGPSVSDTLRETRESLGYDLREVATMLRIRYPYLQAIEAGRFEDLPGTTYAAGFLRSYAECLGLDPDTILTRYKDEAAGRTRSQQLYFPTPVPEGRIPGGTVLLGTMVLAGIVYGGWYYLSATDRSMVDLVPTLPDRLVSLLDTLPFNANQTGGQTAALPAPAESPAAPASVPTVMAEAPSVSAVPPVTASPQAGGASTAVPVPSPPAPVASVPAAPVPTAQAPAAPAKPAAAPAPVVAQPAPVAPAKPSAPTAAPAPAAAPPSAAPSAMVNVPPPPAEDDESEGAAQEPTPLTPAAPVIASLPPAAPAAPPPAADGALPSKVYGTQNTASRIQLRATQDSWIQVRDNSGEIIFTRVLKPGDVYRVPDRSGIRVRTGNAGGLIVVTDGVDGAAMGAVGQVLRDVSLDQHAPTLRGAAPAH